LEPVRVSIREEISALAVETGQVRGSHAKGKDDEEDDEPGADEADILPFDGDSIVFDDLVRDELLLGIPMIPLCSEACPGIRPSPADDSLKDAVDPRLSPLIKFKKQ
jgi:uncharacterized protein